MENFTILDNGWYQIPFTIEDDGAIYQDALALPPEDFLSLTPELFEYAKKQRYIAWKARVKWESSQISIDEAG
jgi:hypothetical protein